MTERERERERGKERERERVEEFVKCYKGGWWVMIGGPRSSFLIGSEYVIFDIARRGNCG